MKVKFNTEENLLKKYFDIKKDKEYEVFSISISIFPDRTESYYRLCDESVINNILNAPTFVGYPTEFFQVVDNAIANNWGVNVAVIEKIQYIEFCDKRIFEIDSFWEKYYNDEDKETIQIVKDIINSYKT